MKKVSDFSDTFERYDRGLERDVLEKLDKYWDFLVETNKQFNLTAITETESAVNLHFLDSLMALPFISGKVCDVGSGAGFPGLVLAAANSELDVTLIDSLNKRVNFLNNAAEVMGLSNVKALHMRAEDAGSGSLRETFDCVTARAVARLDTLAEYCLPLVRVGGKFVAYKTDREEIAASEKAITILGGKIGEIHDFTLQGGEKRSIVVINKVSPTAKKYPRGQNKPRISPLK